MILSEIGRLKPLKCEIGLPRTHFCFRSWVNKPSPHTTVKGSRGDSERLDCAVRCAPMTYRTWTKSPGFECSLMANRSAESEAGLLSTATSRTRCPGVISTAGC